MNAITTAQILAEAETSAPGIFGMTIGEALVTISTFALVVVTGVMIWVSLLLVKVTQRANEIAMRDVRDVAINANDDMADVATTAIKSARARASVVHHR